MMCCRTDYVVFIRFGESNGVVYMWTSSPTPHSERRRKRPKLYTIFPYFSFSLRFFSPFPDLLKKSDAARKERRRKKKKRSENKNNFMLMYLHGSHNKNYVYMWCLLSLSLVLLLLSSCVLLHVSMAALSSFLPSPSSLISYHSFTQHINGNCLHFAVFPSLDIEELARHI